MWVAQAKEPLSGKERALWIVGLGVVTSSALSIKWTTLATPGLIAMESTIAVFFLKKSGACVF